MKVKPIVTAGLLFINAFVFSQQPQFSVQALFGPIWYPVKKAYNFETKQHFNYSVGGYFLLNMPAGKNTISIRSGYYYNLKEYAVNFNHTAGWKPKKYERSYAYNNWPLLFEMRFNLKDKFYPYFSGGIIFSRLISAKQINEKVDGTVSEGFPLRSYIQEEFTDFYASSGVNFRLNKRFLVRLELFMIQQINKDYGDSYTLGGFSYGINTGIQFDIYLPEKWLK